MTHKRIKVLSSPEREPFLMWRFQNRNSRSVEGFSDRMDEQILNALTFRNTKQRETGSRFCFWGHISGLEHARHTPTWGHLNQLHLHLVFSFQSSYTGPSFSFWSQFTASLPPPHGALSDHPKYRSTKHSWTHTSPFSFILFIALNYHRILYLLVICFCQLECPPMV